MLRILPHMASNLQVRAMPRSKTKGRGVRQDMTCLVPHRSASPRMTLKPGVAEAFIMALARLAVVEDQRASSLPAVNETDDCDHRQRSRVETQSRD